MKWGLRVGLLVLLNGCATHHGTGGSGPSPSPDSLPVVKRELPWLKVFGGQMRTTLFYGPWQCRQEFMTACQMECASEGHKLMGCIWLADIKLEWEGSLVIPPLPVQAGGRYAITHCCCDYPKMPPTENAARRQEWSNIRKSFREEWSKKFGNWPTAGNDYWPGHHIRDLGHGGAPIDPNNVIPTPPDVHDVFGKVYPGCYRGEEPWSRVGPYWPYTDK